MNQSTSVLFVCLGNICRSPLGEGIFRHKTEQRGVSHRFVVDSAGTSSYHAGEAPDPGSVRVARENGIDISTQRSRQFVASDLENFDQIIAMDSSNMRKILALTERNGIDKSTLQGRLWLMRNFEEEDDGSGFDEGVPDPWSGGLEGFREVFGIVDRSCENLLNYLLRGNP